MKVQICEAFQIPKWGNVANVENCVHMKGYRQLINWFFKTIADSQSPHKQWYGKCIVRVLSERQYI